MTIAVTTSSPTGSVPSPGSGSGISALRAAPGQASTPARQRDVLARSAFCAVDRLTWSWSRQLTVDEVAGLQLSYSFSTPAQLGDNAPAFSRDVRAAVLGLHPA